MFVLACYGNCVRKPHHQPSGLAQQMSSGSVENLVMTAPGASGETLMHSSGCCSLSVNRNILIYQPSDLAENLLQCPLPFYLRVSFLYISHIQHSRRYMLMIWNTAPLLLRYAYSFSHHNSLAAPRNLVSLYRPVSTGSFHTALIRFQITKISSGFGPLQTDIEPEVLDRGHRLLTLALDTEQLQAPACTALLLYKSFSLRHYQHSCQESNSVFHTCCKFSVPTISRSHIVMKSFRAGGAHDVQ